MPRPLIGLTAGEIRDNMRFDAIVTHGQSYTYVNATIDAGGAPVVIPLTTDAAALRDIYDRLDGLMFCGGNDINPKMYGQEPYKTTTDYSDLRDEVEMQLLTWALTDKKPILGICRGMQLVNIALGGDLYQHIPRDLPEASDHRLSSVLEDNENIAHILSVTPGSQLADILGVDKIGTNTHHHQAIKKLGDGLVVTALAEDGIIEGIEREKPDGFLICVESHPESLTSKDDLVWHKLFEAFVSTSASFK